MDPTQVAAMLQGAQGGMNSSPPTPQQILTIQNMMKGSPGGLGALPQQPGQMMQPPQSGPGQGMNAPLGQMPQQGLAQQQGQANPAMQQAQQQQLMQLLNQQPQPISP